MQRLTHERSNGIKTGYWSPEKKEDLVARLAECENTGLAPDEIESLKKYQWIPVEKPPEERKKLFMYRRVRGMQVQNYWAL